MKRTLIVIVVILLGQQLNAQGNEVAQTEQVYRLLLLNPGIEIELPLNRQMAISTAVGVGYGGGYPETFDSKEGGGPICVISTHLDVQLKWLYNLERRFSRGKHTQKNSGNYVSFRSYIRGPSIISNIERASKYDIAIGPTWGIQRNYGERLHFLFDMGPIYYRDGDGTDGIFPLTVQLNFGINLN